MEIVLLLVALGAFGGLVQGSVGFGLGAIASPIVALVRPELVPVAIMMAGGGLPLATSRRSGATSTGRRSAG